LKERFKKKTGVFEGVIRFSAVFGSERAQRQTESARSLFMGYLGHILALVSTTIA
jgi:hypothetical protein